MEMYINELKRLAELGQEASTDRVKCLIKDLNMQNPQKGMLDTLKSCRVLPIRQINGEITLLSCDSMFTVVDRPIIGRFFEGKLPVLDFDPAEIHSLQPFIKSLSLDNHYMSRTVADSTTADGGNINNELTETFQKRAFALTRYVLSDIARLLRERFLIPLNQMRHPLQKSKLL